MLGLDDIEQILGELNLEEDTEISEIEDAEEIPDPEIN